MRRDVFARSTSVAARWLFVVPILLLVLLPLQPRDVRATQTAPAGLAAADWTAIQALLPTQQAYLKASNTGAGDHFGWSVAVSGDTVVVGAPSEGSSATGVNGNQADNSAHQSGAAYVFVRSGTTWSQQAYLKASNTEAVDSFGFSVAVSGDTVVVGADLEASNTTGVNGDQTDNSFGGAGAAYVFVRSGTTWTQQAYLKASNTQPTDRFGFSVAVSGDTIVVSAQYEHGSGIGVNGNQGDYSAYYSGAAYVFVRSGTTWTQQAYLKASNRERGDFFGSSVAVSGDTVVVGANLEDSGATGVDGNQADNSSEDAGAAYVFVRSGTTWTQQAYLKASNTEAGDHFGSGVAVSGDTVVVGAPYESSNASGVNGNQADNSADEAGAAYVFVRSGKTWTQQAYLKASNTERSDFFGFRVAVSGDTVVVGSHFEDSGATGVDGNQADNSTDEAGAAYVFVRSGATWAQQAYLKASNTETRDLFGASIAVSGDTVVVGARFESSNASGVNGNQADNSADEAGAVYVFVPGTPVVSIPDQIGSPGQLVRVPVQLEQTPSGLLSASLTVSFDPAVLRPHGTTVHSGTLTPDWTVAANSNTPGLLSLALISPGPPASGSGSLVELEFEVIGDVGSSSLIQPGQVVLNDGDIPASLENGMFTVESTPLLLTVRAVQAATRDPLPNTTVQASGPVSVTYLTGTDGSRVLARLPSGSYTLELSKQDGVDRITPFDASLILQHVMGLRTLTGPAFVAGDTTGDGQITAFDATLLLQYTTGSLALPFPAGAIWKFTPPNPVLLSQDQEVVVPGVLIGDVSGYLPLPGQGLRTGSAGPLGALQLVQRGEPDERGERTVELWLRPEGGEVLSLRATLLVDPALVSDLQVRADPSTQALVAAGLSPDGRVRIGLAHAVPLPSGRVVTLRYRAASLEGVRLVESETNQGGVPVWQPSTIQDWLLHLPLARR
ncbi:MAG TPA: hypothetical protein VFS21_36100 [Roseiflexaceae bacterium]|nr:hypothetical protein [Roseiflexaceae bacterium]